MKLNQPHHVIARRLAPHELQRWHKHNSRSHRDSIVITRIFRVQIKPELRASFEKDFQDVSIPLVNSHNGLAWVNIGKPTEWAPDEYVMISRWKTSADLDQLVGKNWNQPLIPPGMEKYVVKSWVHHFEDFN